MIFLIFFLWGGLQFAERKNKLISKSLSWSLKPKYAKTKIIVNGPQVREGGLSPKFSHVYFEGFPNTFCLEHLVGVWNANQLVSFKQMVEHWGSPLNEFGPDTKRLH